MTIHKKFICASFMVSWLLLASLGGIVSAQSSPSITRSTSIIPDFLFQIPIGTTTFIKGADITSGKAIAIYINTFYPWVVAFAAVLAVLAFTFAGVLWLTAGGDSGKTTESKKIMTNAIIGLVLALGSYTFLAALGKDYVNFKPITVKPITPIDINLISAQEELAFGAFPISGDFFMVPITGTKDNPTIAYNGKTYNKEMFGSFWADVIGRQIGSGAHFIIPDTGTKGQYDAPVDVHEAIHRLNNSNSSVYVGNGKYLNYFESGKATLDMVVQRLSPALQNGDKGRFDIYLNTKKSFKGHARGSLAGKEINIAKQNNTSPVQGVLDDFSCYIGNSKVFFEIWEKNLPAKNQPESGCCIYGIPSFVAYSLALAKTLEEKDKDALKKGVFKETLKLLIEDGMNVYQAMKRIDAKEISENDEAMAKALKADSHPKSQALRALAKSWYGATWTQKWLGF